MGATVFSFMPVWGAEAMSDQLVNGANAIEPYPDPVTFDAYTRCLPLYVTVVKSFSEAHPCAGSASAPEEDQRYVEGRAQSPLGGVEGPVRPVHFWLLPPDQQVYSWILVPLAVPAPTASRQSPDRTSEIEPSASRFHCWSALLSQSPMTTAVPLAAPLPLGARHFLP